MSKEIFYGVPSKRKFPLDTEKHVRSAVKFFNYVDVEDEETLAKNLLNRLAYFNITDIKVSEKNRFFNYIPHNLKNEEIDINLSKDYVYKDAITDNANCLIMSTVDNIDPIISESNDKSTLDKDYKPKEKYSLSSYKKLSMKDKSLVKYLKQDEHWTKERIEWLQKSKAEGYFFIDKNKLVAYIIVNDKFISPIYIYPDYRNHGLSDQIMKIAINEMGAEKLNVFKDNEVAINLYHKFGFKKIGEGKDFIKMRLSESFDVLQEGFLSQSTMALRIHPRLEMWEILKKHEYPGFYNLIDKTKKIEDLEYIRKDVYMGKRQFTKLKENLERYKANPKRKNRLLDQLIRKDITSKDIDLTIEYYEKKFIPHINERIKELRNLNESVESLDNKVDPILSIKEQEKNEILRLREIEKKDYTQMYPKGIEPHGYRMVSIARSSKFVEYVAKRELDEGYFELKYHREKLCKSTDEGKIEVIYHKEDDRPERFVNKSKELAYRINPEPLYEFGSNINLNRVKKDIMNDEVIELTLEDLPDNLHITSDIHIYREDEDIVPMKEAIEIINRDVKAEETLLILGDIGYKKDDKLYEHTKEFLDSLNCKNIWLVFGNHDLLSNDQYKELGIKVMAHRMNYRGIIFTHYPVDNNAVNICGHYHKDYLNSHFDLKKSGDHINVFLGHTKRVYSFDEYLKDANINLPKENYYEYQYNEASVLDADSKLRKKQLQAATKVYKELINKYDFKILRKGFVRKLGMEMDYDRYIMGDIHDCKLYLFEYERYNTMKDPSYSSSKTFLQVQAKLHQFVDEMAKELRCKVEMDMNPSNLQTYLIIHAPESAFMESSIAGLAANVSGFSQNNKPNLSYLDDLLADQSINDLDYDIVSEGFLFDECSYLNKEASLDKYFNENLNVFSEGQVFFGEDDREYNVDLWLEKDKDILWITGFTDENAIADYTKQYNCFMRRLDDLKIEMMEKQNIKYNEKDYYNFYYNLFHFIKERYKGKRMIIYGSGVVFFDSSLLKSEPVVIRERSLVGYIMDCIKFDSNYNIIHNVISYNQTKDYLKLFKRNMDKYNVFDSSKEALKYIKSGYLLYTDEEIKSLADTLKDHKYITKDDISCKQVFLSYRKMLEFVEKNKEYTYFSLISLEPFKNHLKKNPLVKETLSIHFNGNINNLCSKNKTQIKRIKEVNSYLSETSFNIDTEGSLIIKTREKTDFMAKYNLSHKLIKIYKKAKNLDGLKHELCKLWFMYIVIEKYYINPKRTPNSDKFKDLQKEAIKAKSFILNEIYQSLDFILTYEPDFDFSKYYEESPYYKDTIKITTDNVKGFKKLIQTIIS